MDQIQKIFEICLQKNSSNNFNKLYTATSSRLYAVLLRILKHEQTAQDCLQEVYMKIWRNLSSYSKSRGNAMSWMSVIARNHALDTLKRKNILHYTDDLSFVGSEEQTVSENLIAAEAGAKIKNCLKRLKPQQEHCILQAYYEGYTYQQIADSLGRPVSTIKTWVSRSLPVLKGCLERLDG